MFSCVTLILGWIKRKQHFLNLSFILGNATLQQLCLSDGLEEYLLFLFMLVIHITDLFHTNATLYTFIKMNSIFFIGL